MGRRLVRRIEKFILKNIDEAELGYSSTGMTHRMEFNPPPGSGAKGVIVLDVKCEFGTSFLFGSSFLGDNVKYRVEVDVFSDGGRQLSLERGRELSRWFSFRVFLKFRRMVLQRKKCEARKDELKREKRIEELLAKMERH